MKTGITPFCGNEAVCRFPLSFTREPRPALLLRERFQKCIPPILVELDVQLCCHFV
jgi:hypothetical protein